MSKSNTALDGEGEGEYSERDLQTVRHSSKMGEVGRKGNGVVSSKRKR